MKTFDNNKSEKIPFHLFLLILIIFLFSACSLVPTPITPPQAQLWLIVSYPADLAVQTASAPQSTSAGMQGVNQKTVTFPDMVTPQTLSLQVLPKAKKQTLRFVSRFLSPIERLSCWPSP